VLDVLRGEPLPAEHPFWTTPGIVVLPHVGGLHPRRDAIVAVCGETPSSASPPASRCGRSWTACAATDRAVA